MNAFSDRFRAMLLAAEIGLLTLAVEATAPASPARGLRRWGAVAFDAIRHPSLPGSARLFGELLSSLACPIAIAQALVTA